jgi:hypothetical protein
MMKKILLILILSFVFNSCDVGGTEDKDFVILPIESVEMPTEYSLGTISEIKVRYIRPTNCHIFNKIYYTYNQNTRFVAIEAVKLNQSNCTPDNESIFEIPLYFKPESSGTYTFKFWLGVDEQNVDQYLIHEVDVF